jgi:hypothetical protein
MLVIELKFDTPPFNYTRFVCLSRHPDNFDKLIEYNIFSNSKILAFQ